MKICVFARLPELGKVKSRLAQTCGVPLALEIYQKMLGEVLSLVETSDYESVLYLEGEDDSKYKLLNQRFSCVKQSSGSLGNRLKKAVVGHFMSTQDKLLVIGTDCIELTQGDFKTVDDYLDEVGVVVGPAKDGGYYLVAMNNQYTCLFDDIDWGSSQVFEQTMIILHEQNISYRLLAEKNDLDFWEDLPQAWQKEFEERCINDN